MKKQFFLSLPALAVLLHGCGAPDATIHWHKVGACNGGVSQTGDPSQSYNAGPNQAYVIFAIENVDNRGVSQAWTLDATKFHVGSASFDPSLMIYSAKLGPFALGTFPIPANVVTAFFGNAYGALVVSTVATDGASEADTESYSLLYTPAAGAPGVIMVQGPVASMAYTPNCADVKLQ
jgi:hypothetical protein